MIMKKDTLKRSRLRRYGRFNTSHILFLGAEGEELIGGTLRYTFHSLRQAAIGTSKDDFISLYDL